MLRGISLFREKEKTKGREKKDVIAALTEENLLLQNFIDFLIRYKGKPNIENGIVYLPNFLTRRIDTITLPRNIVRADIVREYRDFYLMDCLTNKNIFVRYHIDKVNTDLKAVEARKYLCGEMCHEVFSAVLEDQVEKLW